MAGVSRRQLVLLRVPAEFYRLHVFADRRPPLRPGRCAGKCLRVREPGSGTPSVCQKSVFSKVTALQHGIANQCAVAGCVDARREDGCAHVSFETSRFLLSSAKRGCEVRPSKMDRPDDCDDGVIGKGLIQPLRPTEKASRDDTPSGSFLIQPGCRPRPLQVREGLPGCQYLVGAGTRDFSNVPPVNSTREDSPPWRSPRPR